MRSSINAWKNKEAENLEIVVGNFNTVSDNLTETFDYVTLIGVFEYAKTYIHLCVMKSISGRMERWV